MPRHISLVFPGQGSQHIGMLENIDSCFIDEVKPSKLISQFGLDFKQDTKTKVSTYFKNQAEALKLMTEAGWN